MYVFPKDFLWSASTAWDTLVHDGTGKIAHSENADTAIDFYHHWREDVALMKQMGLKAYRFSISWPRVLPEGVGQRGPVLSTKRVCGFTGICATNCCAMASSRWSPCITGTCPRRFTARAGGKILPLPIGLPGMWRWYPVHWGTG